MTARRREISFVSGIRAASDVRHTIFAPLERILRARMKTARFPNLIKVFAAAALLACVAVPAHAQKGVAEPVQITLEARKVVRAADGRESFAAGDVVRPGDVLEYVATYRNTTREAVRGLEATLPIPVHTELLPESVRPAPVRASLDAREFAALPLQRKTVVNGREAVENVPLHEYRFVRWQPVSLGAQASLTFTARVRVLE